MAGDYPDVLTPASVAEAVAELQRLGEAGAPLAGCTWIMRSPSRGDRLRPSYVSLQALDELAGVRGGGPTVIGARVTHAELASLDAGAGALGAIAEAARRSGNRAMRNVATVGGNVCAHPFPQADVVPALLASEASVDVVSPAGAASLALADYLSSRGSRPAGELVVSLSVPAPAGRRSFSERLTVRGSSEYPIVAVSISLDLGADGTVSTARVAVGGVEDVARRVPEAEAALVGARADAGSGLAAGAAAAAAMSGRDGVDAPGWYRLEVLPSVVRNVVARIGEES